MKAVILAGGLGTRFAEETTVRPKPMIEIGHMPILWHIMKIYSAYGINDFVVCCGYKAHIIKEFFHNYNLYRSDITFDLANNKMEVHKKDVEPWRVSLVYTGLKTMTGGRLKRVKDYVGDATFCFTYGDGLTDVNISSVIALHRKTRAIATVTAARHPSRFGILHIEEDKVTHFAEKPVEEAAWMNSGYFVLEPAIFDMIDSDDTVFEKEPIQRAVAAGKFSAYKHEGFFMGMDSVRERNVLEELWNSGKAPWQVW